MTTSLATNCCTNLTEVHTNINGNATGTEGQNNPDNEPSLACVSESNHTDVENNSLSEGKIEDQISPANSADTNLLPEREEKSDETGKVTPIPTYDLSSEDNITRHRKTNSNKDHGDIASSTGCEGLSSSSKKDD